MFAYLSNLHVSDHQTNLKLEVNTNLWFLIMISLIEWKKTSKPTWPYVKSNCSLNLTIGYPTLCSKNYNQLLDEEDDCDCDRR